MDDDKFASMSREEKEAEVKRQQEELRRLLAEHTDLIKTVALEKPELFIRHVCEYELGIGDSENNIFSRYDKNHRPIYQDIASAILRRLEKEDEGKTHDEQEYVLLADYAASYLRPYVSSRIFDREPKDPSRLPYLFFESKSEECGCGISAASELAQHGLPLFYLQADGTYQQLAFDHPDHIFVFMMKEQMGWIQTTDLPPWARKYYVKAEHIRTERLYFASDNLKPEDIPALRKSLRAHLGIKDFDSGEQRTGLHAMATSQDWTHPFVARNRITLGEAATIMAGFDPYGPGNFDDAQEADIQRWGLSLTDAVDTGQIEASTWSQDRGREQMLVHADIRAWCARFKYSWLIPDSSPQSITSTESLAEINRLKVEIDRLNAELVEAKQDAAMVDHDSWPEELDIALTAWRAAVNNAEKEGKKPGAYIRSWLDATYPKHAGSERHKRIAIVANWDKTPGPR